MMAVQNGHRRSTMEIAPYYPDVEIPDVPLTGCVMARAREFGDKAAFIDGTSGRVITYTQLADSIGAVAGAMAAKGFKKGDVAAIYSPNIPEYAIVFHAAATLGGAATTVNPLYTAEELNFQLNDAGATVLFTIGMFLDKAVEAAKNSNVTEIITFDGVEGTTAFASMFGGTPATQVDVNPAEDVVVLPYSSGTTGLPKGVMLTHRNLVANLAQCDAATECRQLTSDDTLIAVLPFFHIYGMVVIMNFGLYKGCTTVTLPRFDMEQFLGVMEKYSVTVAHLVPPIVLGLTKHPAVDNFDLSKLDLIFCGAAPLSEGVAADAAARLDCQMQQGYGLTETSPVTHMARTIGDNPSPVGSIGVNISNTEARLVDLESGEIIAQGETGELLVRGPQVMKGYLNNPEATAHTVDSDGWLHTGDIAYVDEAGHCYIVDRVKELIKYKGMQVAPAELEALLLTHPAVSDVAVIPSPDEEAGEVPKAFVVKSTDVDAETLMAFVAGQVAPHKKVRLLEFIDAVPKSASGKIMRRLLVAEEREKVAAAG
jgi:acyl-CoA synthetase (AMP-forming)/AMP-acid ligase II